MNKDIEQRIRYVKAKIRNIGYYWEYDESLGEVRSRKQYMHVLRTLREQLLMIVKEAGTELVKEDKELFNYIISCVSPKISTLECGDVIRGIKKYVDKQEKKRKA